MLASATSQPQHLTATRAQEVLWMRSQNPSALAGGSGIDLNNPVCLGVASTTNVRVGITPSPGPTPFPSLHLQLRKAARCCFVSSSTGA